MRLFHLLSLTHCVSILGQQQAKMNRLGVCWFSLNRAAHCFLVQTYSLCLLFRLLARFVQLSMIDSTELFIVLFHVFYVLRSWMDMTGKKKDQTRTRKISFVWYTGLFKLLPRRNASAYRSQFNILLSSSVPVARFQHVCCLLSSREKENRSSLLLSFRVHWPSHVLIHYSYDFHSLQFESIR